MKPRISLRTVCLGLVLLLIVAMCSQVEFRVPVGGGRFPVTIADVVLAVAFVGAVLHVLSRRLRGTRHVPVQAVALVAVALVALARTRPLTFNAVKEPLQLAEYFLFAFFVFVNVAETRDLRPMLVAFVAATAGVVVWAGVHYFAVESPFHVRGSYANRNLLGAFLAIALPVLYGLALHARRWPWRLVLLAVVLVGLAVNLSGGALLATLVVLGLLSALRGQRALIPYAVFLCIATLLGPRLLPRRGHTDALFGSVAVTVDDNFLLSDRQMVARARELLHPTRKIPADHHSGEMIMPQPRPLDARRLLRLLGERRNLVGSEVDLYADIVRTIEASVSQQRLDSYPLDRPHLAVRYQRWDAAVGAARQLFSRPLDALFGRGIVPYHETLKPFMTARLQYRTDEPEVYNIAAPEPFTHNLWLKTLVLTGLLGFLALAWLVASFLGRAARLYREARSELALGTALGAIGGILGFALAGLFTETIVRGIGMPFVFVLAAVAITERIVRGEGQSAIEQLTRYD